MYFLGMVLTTTSMGSSPSTMTLPMLTDQIGFWCRTVQLVCFFLRTLLNLFPLALTTVFLQRTLAMKAVK